MANKDKDNKDGEGKKEDIASLEEARARLKPADAMVNILESPMAKRTIFDLSLAEFPIFFFSPLPEGTSSYTYQDTINLKGLPLKRSWEVKWHPTDGYPSASTFEVFFTLLQIAREQGFPRYIDFGSIYALRKRMGKKNPNTDYDQTIRDLRCLRGIRIIAINSFWDNEERLFRPALHFGLFDELSAEVPKQEEDEFTHYRRKKQGKVTHPAIVKMGDIFRRSLQNGNLLLSFESDFFLSLPPLAQRLALIVTKYMRFSKNKDTYKRNLKKFAEQIPIFAKEQYNIKRQLKRSLTSLKEAGLPGFKDFSFYTNEQGEEIIAFTFVKTEAARKILESIKIEEEPKKAKTLPFVPKPSKSLTPKQIDALPPYLQELYLNHTDDIPEE